MASKINKADIYVATESFSTVIGDEHYAVVKKQTRVRGDHVLLDACPEYFKPVEDELSFEVERATAAPGEKRSSPAKASKAE
jgi:hypothetical protein